MTTDEFLDGLLIASIVLSTCLLLIAMAGLGRRFADWELQTERKIVGVSRIQAAIAIRGQIGTVLLAFVFVIINIMLFVESPQIARMWVNRVAWTLLLTLLLVHAVVDWMAERKQVRLLIAEEDAMTERLIARAAEAESRREAEVLADRDSYRQMAEEAIGRLEQAIKDGVPAGQIVLPVLAPVVPEHSSPSTPEQRAVAARQTMRARLVAATVSAGQDPGESMPEPPVPDPLASVDVASIQPEAVQAIADAVQEHHEGQTP
jgi:hypothetical protein